MTSRSFVLFQVVSVLSGAAAIWSGRIFHMGGPLPFKSLLETTPDAPWHHYPARFLLGEPRVSHVCSYFPLRTTRLWSNKMNFTQFSCGIRSLFSLTSRDHFAFISVTCPLTRLFAILYSHCASISSVKQRHTSSVESEFPEPQPLTAIAKNAFFLYDNVSRCRCCRYSDRANPGEGVVQAVREDGVQDGRPPLLFVLGDVQEPRRHAADQAVHLEDEVPTHRRTEGNR